MKKVILAIILGFGIMGSAFATTDYCSRVVTANPKYKATKVWNCACSRFATKNSNNDWVYNSKTSVKDLLDIRAELQVALIANNEAVANKLIAASPNSPKEVQTRIQNTLGIVENFLAQQGYKEPTKEKK